MNPSVPEDPKDNLDRDQTGPANLGTNDNPFAEWEESPVFGPVGPENRQQILDLLCDPRCTFEAILEANPKLYCESLWIDMCQQETDFEARLACCRSMFNLETERAAYDTLLSKIWEENDEARQVALEVVLLFHPPKLPKQLASMKQAVNKLANHSPNPTFTMYLKLANLRLSDPAYSQGSAVLPQYLKLLVDPLVSKTLSWSHRRSIGEQIGIFIIRYHASAAQFVIETFKTGSWAQKLALLSYVNSRYLYCVDEALCQEGQSTIAGIISRGPDYIARPASNWSIRINELTNSAIQVW